jgi:Protein of unknown function (DUF4087)
MKTYLALTALIALTGMIFISGSLASEKPSVSPEPAAAESVALSLPTVKRCGWFANPTPGNAWLSDKDDEWTIGAQGGFQAEGNWPTFPKSMWVKTNGSYGYGCACITGTFNGKSSQVVEIKRAVARPLSACKKDKALKAPQ